jgi:Prokaryotic N-terminal methylation motif
MSAKPFAIAAARRTRGGFTRKQRGCASGFTLAELLVSVFVLSIIILMVAQLMTSATAITRTGHTHISTDTQARTVFDRMAVDLAQMLKRTDVDYYVKGQTTYAGHGNGHGWGNRTTGQQGSDQIAFFSHVPGYYPSGAQSPVSLVVYRVNQGASTDPAYLRLQRMGKGLLWNGVDTQTNQNGKYPIVFLPQTIAGVGAAWSAAIKNDNSNASRDSDYETIGPGVFRFEYYYLLKTGKLTDVPWNTDSTAGPVHTSLAGIGLGDVESITMAIAVIDPAGRALIDAASPSSLLDLASDMFDFKTAHGRGFGGTRNIGDLEADWTAVLVGDPTQGLPGVITTGQTSNSTPVPPEAAKAIRIYSKTFDLRTL